MPMKSPIHFRFLLTASLALGGPYAFADEGTEYFEKRIRPLLIEKCLDCHSEEKKIKGGLRLDTKEGWQAGGDSGAALVPMEPAASLIMKAVSYTDRDLKMPPKEKMSQEDIEALQQWIALGAPDPRHSGAPEALPAKPSPAAVLEKGKAWWSFQPLKNVTPPEVQDRAWARNDIDRFVLARLEASKLKATEDASPEALGRRIYFDLTGLPPAPAELEAFVQAAKQDPNKAVRETMDKLLNSAAYGERWGRHWLDLVRFAESSGGGRTLPFKEAWRFRDYVIESMNEDVPLNRFLTEQIAGDLLPHSTTAERRRNVTATGFFALGPTNYEEQDKQMLRMDIVDEQLDTIGKSFMGMTIGCARCHDHKFDPIPATDYYAMAGILRSTRTLRNYKDNVARWVETRLPTEGEQEAKLQAVETELTKAEEELVEAKKLVKTLQPKNFKLEGGKPVDVAELPGLVVDDSQAKLVGVWKNSVVYPSYIGSGYLTDKNQNKGNCTITFAPPIKESGVYEVRFSYTALSDRASNVPVTIFHADGEENIIVNERETPGIDSRFISLGQYRFQNDGQGYVMLSNEGTDGFVTADAMIFIPVKDLTLAAAQEEKVAKSPAFADAQKNLKDLEKKVKTLAATAATRPEAMSVIEDEAPEDCPIHIRGSIRNLGQKVPRGFLTIATHGDAPKIGEKESGRLQLAQWMTSDTNPLTARVLVNRVWMYLMGEGLVRSVDNFGTTGEHPSHPELLDALALQFIKDGWSLKKLVSNIVTSRTYQMSSRVNAEMVAIDPENKLLWRQNRRRMDAESLRDSILTVSGALERQVGGPNVKREAMDAKSDSSQDTEYSYVFTDTRRSIYTPAFRNKRLELFEAFDFADINQPIGRRTTSTVAPQALYFMNHPFVLEQSRKAAERLIATGSDDATLIRQAYLETVGRAPSVREQGLAADFVQVSASDAEAASERLAHWSLLIQTLFASVEFRYLN